jgi:hypothetical protein
MRKYESPFFDWSPDARFDTGKRRQKDPTIYLCLCGKLLDDKHKELGYCEECLQRQSKQNDR